MGCGPVSLGMPNRPPPQFHNRMIRGLQRSSSLSPGAAKGASESRWEFDSCAYLFRVCSDPQRKYLDRCGAIVPIFCRSVRLVRLARSLISPVAAGRALTAPNSCAEGSRFPVLPAQLRQQTPPLGPIRFRRDCNLHCSAKPGLSGGKGEFDARAARRNCHEEDGKEHAGTFLWVGRPWH